MPVKRDDYLLEVAERIGELTSATKAQEKAIDALFKYVRDIKDDVSDLKTGLSSLKLKLLGLGIVGGFLAKLFFSILGFIKKLPWEKW